MRLLPCLSLGLFGCLLVVPFVGGFQVCRTGWMIYNRYCYGYFPEEVTWKEAKSLCRHRHTYLGEIVEGKEPEELAEFLKRRGANQNVWVEVDFTRGMVTSQSALVKKLDFLMWTSMTGKDRRLPYLCMEKKKS